jgi:hypothetical protein
VLRMGADLVPSADIEASSTSSEELLEDSVECLSLLGRNGDRIGDVIGRDLTLVGVRVRS